MTAFPHAGAADPGGVPTERPGPAWARWRHIWPLLSAAAVGAVLTLLVLRLVAPHYTAQMVVGPTGRSGAAAMGARAPAGAFSMSRPIAETGSGDEVLSDFARYLELLTSVLVAERLAGDADLLRALFPAAWNDARRAWAPPASPIAWAGRLARRLAGHVTWAPPDGPALATRLRGLLVMEVVPGGPMRRIILRYPDRDMAVRLLTRLHQEADGLLREEAARRTRAEIAFLRRRLAEGTTAETHRLLSGLLADQERLLLMIDLNLPFAADLVVPPTAPRLSDWPDPAVLLPLGSLSGVAIALFLLSARRAWKGPR